MKYSPALLPTLVGLGLPLLSASAAEPGTTLTLPGTAPLTWPEADLSARLMDGAHAFVERKIAEAREKRPRHWAYDTSSPEAYETSIAPNREGLRRGQAKNPDISGFHCRIAPGRGGGSRCPVAARDTGRHPLRGA